MYLDASELIRYRAPGTDGGAHSDIFRPATGRLLWNVIEKPAPGSEVPGALPADLRGFWGYFFPIAITLATSALYELAEWGAAEVFGGDLGVAFLGTQGDVWDAQKDMALAGIGAIVAMAITMALNYALERDFAREWSESFRVKVPRPLGEDELRRLWHEREDSSEPPTEARSAVRRD